MSVIYLFLSLYAFWLLYIIYAAWAAKWSTLPKLARWGLAPAALIMGFIDVVVMNYIVATVIFLELPASLYEVTLTRRLTRYRFLGSPTGLDHWRHEAGYWICVNLLNPFEVNGHCTKGQA